MNQVIKIFILLLIVTGFAMPKSQAQEVVVIVNSENPVASMSQIEVKLYYMRKIKQQWPAMGIAILPAGLSANSSAKSGFLSQIMKMTDSELAAYFKQRQFANAEAIPEKFSSETELIAYVANNKGAIAYVSQSAFENADGGIKAVLSK